MKLAAICIGILVLSTVSALAQAGAGPSANDIDGTWIARIAGTPDAVPASFDAIVFDFKVDGTRLSGQVRIGNWPGTAPLTDGKIEGDRISFTFIGRMPANGDQYPIRKFNGTIRGNSLKITMVEVSTDPKVPGNREWPMEGQRVSR